MRDIWIYVLVSLIYLKSLNSNDVFYFRGKKREGFQCKIVNGFHVTVMILMDSGLNDAYPT
jgi:hypothetical protein